MRYFVCCRNSNGMESSPLMSAAGGSGRDCLPAEETLACRDMAKAGLVARSRWTESVDCSAVFRGGTVCWSKEFNFSGGVCARNVSQLAQVNTWACKRSRASSLSLPNAKAASCRGDGCADCFISIGMAPEKIFRGNRAGRRIVRNIKSPPS